MRIETSNDADISEIFKLYGYAIEYQRTKVGAVLWPEFEEELVKHELEEKRQWKLVIDEEVACVWTITFSDLEIWQERNVDAAIYIHRIATNPKFRGNDFVSIIVKWAIPYAKNLNKDFVRLDTLGQNDGLIKHYTRAGFDYLGLFDMTDTKGLPAHYQNNIQVALFEIKLSK
jgi:ribosomal protein S18 acetylase RimI-like enzyme